MERDADAIIYRRNIKRQLANKVVALAPDSAIARESEKRD